MARMTKTMGVAMRIVSFRMPRVRLVMPVRAEASGRARASRPEKISRVDIMGRELCRRLFSRRFRSWFVLQKFKEYKDSEGAAYLSGILVNGIMAIAMTTSTDSQRG